MGTLLGLLAALGLAAGPAHAETLREVLAARPRSSSTSPSRGIRSSTTIAT